MASRGGLLPQDRLSGSSVLLTGTQSRLPSSRHRHRHLESSSYRTLVRIFSLCLELDECPVSPIRESTADPSPNLEAAPESSSVGKDSIAGRGIVSREESGLGEEKTAEVSTCPYSKDSTLYRDGVGIATIDELGHRDKDLEKVTGFVLTGLLGQNKESLEDQNGYSDKLDCLALEKPQCSDSQVWTSYGMNNLDQVDKEVHSSTIAELQISIVNPMEGTSLHKCAATQSPGEAIFHDLVSNPAQDDLVSIVEGLQGDVGNSKIKNDFSKPLTIEDHIQFQRKNNIELGQSPSEVLADKTDAAILCQSQKSSFAVPGSLREIYKGDSDRGLEMDVSIHKLVEAGAQHKKSVLTNDSYDILDAKPESAVINDKHKCIEYPNQLSEKAYADLESLIVDLDSSDEIEEGQIPDDFLSLDESMEPVHDTTQLEDQKSSRKSPFDTCMALKSGTGQDSIRDNFVSPKQHLSSQNEPSDDEPSDTEVVKVGAKRKKGPMTAERKAKKKEAKRRKRAQQGVKRLKLQMIVKPKTVQYCNFYLKGRCQQGDACKFSHDTTPLTKSMPCKFFASDSCLKADDCPFDHQLSNYPCHNFLNNGMCSRGDRCKFSHKISEGSSPAAVTSNLVSLSTLEKLESTKKNRNQRGIANASDASKIKPQNSSSVDQVLANMAKPPRKPLVVPKGIRFLSLGDDPSKIHKKPLFQKSISRTDCNEKIGDMFPGNTHLCSSVFPEKPLHVVHTDRDRMSVLTTIDSASALALKDLKSQKFTEGTCLIADSRSLQSEISEASKILEEFLFV